MSDDAAQNTDKEIWRNADGSDRIMVTESGSIGIGYSGEMFIKPIEQWHALASATLRAALTPPADDEIEAIRLRAAATGGADPEYVSMLFGQKIADAFADRATLLRALDAERARRVEVEGALVEVSACFAAAEAEGLAMRLWGDGHQHEVGDLHDLVIRRLYPAAEAARATLTKETP